MARVDRERGSGMQPSRAPRLVAAREKHKRAEQTVNKRSGFTVKSRALRERGSEGRGEAGPGLHLLNEKDAAVLANSIRPEPR